MSAQRTTRKTKTTPRLPVIPNILEEGPNRDDLYFGTMVERFIKLVLKRRDEHAKKYGLECRLSIQNLARCTGENPRTVYAHFSSSNRTISIKKLDRYLWAARVSLLDLIEPHELASYLESLTWDEAQLIRTSLKRLLDKRFEQAQNQTSEPEDSQIQL